MIYEENNFSSKDGLKLYYQAWKASDPKAVVQILHGVQEHSGRYMNVVNKLVPEGYSIYASDFRGHGKSEGRRGFANSFEQLVDDIQSFYEIVRKEIGNEVPYFILGHSMGSELGLLHATKYQDQVKGYVFSAAGNDQGAKVPKILVILSSVMSKLLPKQNLKNPIVLETLSRDQKTLEERENDDLVFDTISFRLGRELLVAFSKMEEWAGVVIAPCLFQSGQEDMLIVGTKDVYDACSSKDKTLKIYPDCKHEIYNEIEPDRATVLNDLQEWLDKHI